MSELQNLPTLDDLPKVTLPDGRTVPDVFAKLVGEPKEPKRGAVLIIDHAHVEIMKRHGARMDRAWRGNA